MSSHARTEIARHHRLLHSPTAYEHAIRVM
jgi:hypothetical protein